MKLILIPLLVILFATQVKAQPTNSDTQEEKINYYANINNNYKTTAQKNKYKTVADVMGLTSLVLLGVSTFSFTQVSSNNEADPDPLYLISSIVSGFLACIVVSIALIYHRKIKNLIIVMENLSVKILK